MPHLPGAPASPAINFVRGAAIFANIFMPAVLVGKTAQKGGATQAAGNVANLVFAHFVLRVLLGVVLIVLEVLAVEVLVLLVLGFLLLFLDLDFWTCDPTIFLADCGRT